jgi:hypothetical protein
MLLKDDKKKMVTTIIGKLGKSTMEETPMENGAEQDDSIGMDSCAEEIIKAIEEKNPKALVEAMKSMMEMMDAEPEQEKTEY